MIFRGIFKSEFTKSIGVYTVTSVINSAIPFLLLPLLTRYLNPGDYGIVSMFGVLVSLISPFIGLSIHGSVARMYYEKDTIDLESYISNCLLILIVSTSIVSIVFYAFANIISKISSFPINYLWAVILVCFGQFITRIVLVLWQVQKKTLQYGTFQIAKTIINTALSIWFIIGLGMAWEGRIIAQVITFIVFVIYGVLLLCKKRWVKLKFNRDYIMHSLKFGIPLIPHVLGGVIITMSDRIFITNMVGIGSTGIYTVGYQVGSIINLFADSFNKAYVPYLYERLKKNKEAIKQKLVKFTYIYFVIIVLTAIVLSVVAPWFLSFFVGKSFTGSSVFVIWIALGYAFSGMYYMVSSYIFYTQKTQYLAWVTFCSGIINLFLNYYLIDKFGAIGAAQATTIVYFIRFIITWIISARVFSMPWNILGKTQVNN